MYEDPYSIKSYVLRGGRITKAQQRALDTLSGFYGIPFDDTILDFNAVFNNGNPVTVEIGFGMGSATAEIASANPQKNYIGIEVFRTGIGRLFMEIEKRRLANIRVIEYDVTAVLKKMIPVGSIDAFHIFFPDPWPKKRQNKRRLVRLPFTNMLASRLRPGGCVYMVSDNDDYCNFALAELTATRTLHNAYIKFARRQDWRPLTKFEKKAIASGKDVKELIFVKKPESVP
ncbi:MAG: tRNA (guanosine(46)-N7)-methyltransferase TrmB [Spirochaetaceae bacterium]|jgi:tRNA (guanine-N7-)-methyltransferase|nr:tRNA (guanosine(46)-N7)-methyltransferase TrmB [Spirochaetaceae bacterium]